MSKPIKLLVWSRVLDRVLDRMWNRVRVRVWRRVRSRVTPTSAAPDILEALRLRFVK